MNICFTSTKMLWVYVCGNKCSELHSSLHIAHVVSQCVRYVHHYQKLNSFRHDMFYTLVIQLFSLQLPNSRVDKSFRIYHVAASKVQY